MSNMMRRSAWVVAAATLLVAGVLGQGEQGAADGRTAYARVGCARCHGADGRGTVAAPSIGATARELAAFVAYVRRPTGSMTALGPDTVSDEALAAIYTSLYPCAAAAAKADQAAASAGRADIGAALYQRYGCFQCHSNEGQGGTQGPRVGPNPIPFARFSWYVRHSSGDMPPYTAVVMSDQDIADVYVFLQARPQPPPVEGIPLLAP